MGNEQLPFEGETPVEEIKIVGGGNSQSPQPKSFRTSRSSIATAMLLREVLNVQSERVKTYSAFEQGFLDYRTSGDEQAYVGLCQEVTAKFSHCSQQIIRIEAALKEGEVNRADLAETLRALQSQEKKKLHMTAVLQVLKKAGRPSERLGELREELRRQQAHQCHSEAALNGGAAEPSGLMEAQEEAEYEAAVGEATRGVQDAVTEINEKLEEIKYELADLEEPGEVDVAPKESLEPGVG